MEDLPECCSFTPSQDNLLSILEDKVRNGRTSAFVQECDLYGEKEPWDIWKEYGGEKMGKEGLYFFTKLKKVSQRGSRISRRVGSGIWSGANCVEVPGGVGKKRHLRYETNTGGPEHGRWLMSEYSLSRQAGDECVVLCHLKESKRRRVSQDPKESIQKAPSQEVGMCSSLPTPKDLISQTDDLGCLSDYLIMCLTDVEEALRSDGRYMTKEDASLFSSSWGNEFWKCYLAGEDVQTSGVSSTIEQIAWIVCCIADSVHRNDEDGLSPTGPFLLFIVQSHERARMVRSVCIPLKKHGVHAVSIHPFASLNHQVQGLKKCDPKIVIATPSRLLQLIDLKAIDLSTVSFLVIDGLESEYQVAELDSIKKPLGVFKGE